MRNRYFPLFVLTAAFAALAPWQAEAVTPKTCFIYVHGKQTNQNTLYNWNYASDYWRGIDPYGIPTDFVGRVNNFGYYGNRSWYIVNYDGTAEWYNNNVAWQIYNATNGGRDGGGNSCAYSYANGGRFIVIAHSMGAVTMDALLGNSRPGDPYYNYNGQPLSTIAQRISHVISLSGAHGGSQLADRVCGGGGLCGLVAGWYASCDRATYWLRTAPDARVSTYANSPARTVVLYGGFKAMASSGCLSGEDDGAVQYGSQFACYDPTWGGYNNYTVCNNSAKQESYGFKNFGAVYENHSQIKDCSQTNVYHVAVPDGSWYWGGTKYPAGQVIRNMAVPTCEVMQAFGDTYW